MGDAAAWRRWLRGGGEDAASYAIGLPGGQGGRPAPAPPTTDAELTQTGNDSA